MSFENEFLKTKQDKEKFKSEFLIQSLLKLNSESTSIDYLTGKQKVNFDVDNNFLAIPEKTIKRLSLNESRLRTMMEECAYMKYGLVKKYNDKVHTEEHVSIKQLLFKLKMKIALEFALPLCVFGFVGYQFSFLSKNTKLYLGGFFCLIFTTSFFMNAITC